MQDDEADDNQQQVQNDTQEEDAMSQGTDPGDTNKPNTHKADILCDSVEAPKVNRYLDVNGGIDNNALLDMMANDVNAMHTHTSTDLSPACPFGSGDEQC